VAAGTDTVRRLLNIAEGTSLSVSSASWRGVDPVGRRRAVQTPAVGTGSPFLSDRRPPFDLSSGELLP